MPTGRRALFCLAPLWGAGCGGEGAGRRLRHVFRRVPEAVSVGDGWSAAVVGLRVGGDGLRVLAFPALTAASVRAPARPERGLLQDRAPEQCGPGFARGVMILLAETPVLASDASQPLDAKAANPAPAGTDPRAVLLVAEAFRHAKPIGCWGDVDALMEAAGADPDAPGIVTGSTSKKVLDQIIDLLAEHRVWDRFPAGQRPRP